MIKYLTLTLTPSVVIEYPSFSVTNCGGALLPADIGTAGGGPAPPSYVISGWVV